MKKTRSKSHQSTHIKKNEMNSHGFSLIPFLIALISLGVLVAGVLASLDPLEQFNKMRDETLQNNAAEFISANVQYYAKYNALPWFSKAQKGAGCYGKNTTIPSVQMKDISDCLYLLVNEGNLDQSFIAASNLTNLIVTNPNPQTGKDLDTIVCFIPFSKAHQLDDNTRFQKDGSDTPQKSCKSQGGQNACYWCTQ